jgi:hypothetical protein
MPSTWPYPQVETRSSGGGGGSGGNIVRVDEAGIPLPEGAGGGPGGGHRYACGIGPMQIAVAGPDPVNMRR